MVLNNSTTSISFRPLVSFDGTSVNLYIEHKPTKTTVSSLSVVPTITGTKVSIVVPSLSTINAVANNLDELNIRVIKNNVLLYEYMAYWITGTYDEYKQWKTWTTTSNNSKSWITL
jgi:hypothetical protein